MKLFKQWFVYRVYDRELDTIISMQLKEVYPLCELESDKMMFILVDSIDESEIVELKNVVDLTPEYLFNIGYCSYTYKRHLHDDKKLAIKQMAEFYFKDSDLTIDIFKMTNGLVNDLVNDNDYKIYLNEIIENMPEFLI